jgi:4'-phosphopantetheinyl transferase EntD
LIAALLPAAAAVEWARGDLDGVELYPEEAAVVARAVEKRRREFATGRALARSALERLGVPARAIPPGERGEPLWPDGVVGSITHCAGYRACAVAPASELVAIGIDAEPDEPLPPGVLESIARPEELRALGERRAREPGVHLDRLLFSAKEAVFKTWFPLTGQRLGFEDATLAFGVDTFAANLPTRSVTLSGRWGRSDGLVLTAIALSPDWRVGA